MTEGDAVWLVADLRDYYAHWQVDRTFACGRCRATIALFDCTFTANRWEDDGTVTHGALLCPQCGKGTARAFVWDEMKHDAQMRKAAREDMDEDEEDAEADEDY